MVVSSEHWYSIEEADLYLHDGMLELSTLTIDGSTLRMHGYVEKPAVPRYVGRFEVTVSIPDVESFEVEDEARMNSISLWGIERHDGSLKFISQWPTFLTVVSPTERIQIATEDEPFALQKFFRFKKLREPRFI